MERNFDRLNSNVIGTKVLSDKFIEDNYGKFNLHYVIEDNLDIQFRRQLKVIERNQSLKFLLEEDN